VNIFTETSGSVRPMTAGCRRPPQDSLL